MKKNPTPVKDFYIEYRKIGDMVLVIVNSEKWLRGFYPGYFVVAQWVELKNGKQQGRRLLALTAELRDAWRVFFAHEVK